ncbi:helix-turn-helix transcriptional regulator [Corynebacterium comes]|uniref:WYL domain-containing protein n=1 Tax=Corynebacterium comes TaxID=2675218 RepID=A0A6B8VTA9_9CORY|nr:WYL domain-containing protein [Corynebacterium comes]QGU04594.1 hypothetical protein CETAM_06660 [Corynebacterium comes]
MVKTQLAVSRLTNLVFALIDADRNGGRMLTPAWIREHVNGYQGLQDDAFLTKLRRDIATLGRAGVPLTSSPSGDGVTTYRLLSDQYDLPEVTFTPEEAAVLGLAGEMGQSSELGAFARSGWTKLAASGVSRDLSQAPVFTNVNDLHRLPPELLKDTLTIIRQGLRMTFDYLATPTSEPVRRVMDAWSLVPLHDRFYLVGHDIERDEPRCFRIRRIRNVRALRTRATHTEPPENPQDIVEKSLRVGRRRIDAVLSIPPGTALELAEAGTRRHDGLVELLDVDRDWLARTAAGFAPAVVVHEPADVRADILALLKDVAP